MGDLFSSVLDLCIIGIFALLLGATVVLWVLLKKDPLNHTLLKVQTIVKSWWAIATPVLVSFKIGPHALLILFFVVTCYALVEIIKHTKHFENLRGLFNVIFILSTALQYLAIYMGWKMMFLALIPLLLVWIIPALVIFRAEIASLPLLIAAVVGPLLTSYYLSHIPALPLLVHEQWKTEESALVAILFLVFATELNDVMQFLTGKAFGRRKIFPLVSPNKTEAGFLGGLIGTTLLFVVLGPMFLEINWRQAMIAGPLISITGIFGDLLFSSVKRYYGVKDFSALIPGHGGLVDRLDSLILTAPVYFHLLYVFKGGVL